MKINNKKTVKAKAYRFAFVMITSATVLLFCYLTDFYKNETLRWPLVFVVAILLYSVWQLSALKCFDYEHSGEVISIKYFRPWKMGIITPDMEVPKQKLACSVVKKDLFRKKLCLTIRGSTDRKFLFQYNLSALSQKQIAYLEESLQEK